MRPLYSNMLRGAATSLLASALVGCALIGGSELDRDPTPSVTSAPAAGASFDAGIQNATWTPPRSGARHPSSWRSVVGDVSARPETDAADAYATTRHAVDAAIGAAAGEAAAVRSDAASETTTRPGLGLPIAVLVLVLLGFAATRFAALEKTTEE